VVGDYLEEEGKETGRESGRDYNETEEQPTLESIQMVGKGVAKKKVIILRRSPL